MKTGIRQLVDELRSNKCSIELNDMGNINLILQDKAELPKELIAKVKENKQDLIDYLKFSMQKVDLKIEKVAAQTSYAISDAQRRLWVLSQFEEGSVAYNMPSHVSLDQAIDVASFQRAIESTIDRHEILRTVFREDETGDIRQWILKREDLDFKIDYRDLRKEANKEEKVKEYVAEDSYKLFDLERGPLLRASLMQIEEERYVFYYNMHHIISDGWSMDILSRDVLSYYVSYKENKDSDLKELRIQYKDYSAWALAQLEEEQYRSHKDYWLNSLAGELPLIDLPGTKQRPKLKTNRGHGLSTHISSATTGKLKAYSQQHGGSLFMGLLAAWNVLIYRYTSQTDIIIGTPVAGREHADLEDQIGFYINTLALRNEINPEESFDELFTRIKQNTLEAFSHQMYPFDRLVEELNLQRDTSRSAVFDIMLVLQNNGEKIEDNELKQEDELNRIVDHGHMASKFDLDLSIQEIGNYLSLQLTYNPSVYEREMVEDLINHYRQLLNTLLESPKEKIGQIDFLSKKEKHELLVIFNNTKAEYPKDKTIVNLFEAQVAKTPNNVAVRFKEKELTYQELEETSNQLARYLQKNYDIKPDDLIAIKQERNEWMIISILGVLKSGAAYVPIDPEYPQDRIDYILKDSRCKVLIDEKELERFTEEKKTYAKKNLKPINKSDDLAYVIYTSGTTGNPKGVMVENRSVTNLIYSQTKEFDISDTERILQFSNCFFDASVEQIFLALFNGACLVIVPKDLRLNAGLFEAFILKERITHLHATPGFLETIDLSNCKFLKRIIAGGDICKKELSEKWTGVADFYNEYGPTETTVTAIEYFCPNNNIESKSTLPIGKPLSNTQVYILNENLLLSPKGVIGEICLSGEGLARGYLNQQKLTKEKFIANPFKAGERLYKTGDIGRWLSDGNIEFIGRKDDQVKIRGYRIELGEIEHALLKNKNIEETVVVARENQNNEKELVAYIIGKEEQNISELRSFLKTTLPDYMLPAYYVQMKALPLTTNGKIDKKSLPDPQEMGISNGVEYVAPRNEIEEKLVKIWEEVLQRENIGIKDDFFTLGGHSLRAAKVVSKINHEFELGIKIGNLYSTSNIEDLSSIIDFSIKQKNIRLEIKDLKEIEL